VNAVNRMRAAINGAPHDYPPSIWIATAVVCRNFAIPQVEWSHDADLLADSLIRFSREIGCDGIYVTRDNLVTHEALGGAIDWPPDDEPMLKKPVLTEISDWHTLDVPQPETAAGMQTVLQAARLASQNAGDEFYVMANIDCGPFTTAANLLGVQRFLGELAGENRQAVHGLLEFCTELVIAYGKAMQRTGVRGIQMGEASASLINPDHFAAFALPYIRRAAEALADNRGDLWLHICGNSEHLLHQLRDLPIQVLEIDAQVPLRRAGQSLGNRMALKGNIDTLLLQNENPQQIYERTQKMIRTSDNPRRLIVSAGCGVPRQTPLENLQAACRACSDTLLS